MQADYHIQECLDVPDALKTQPLLVFAILIDTNARDISELIRNVVAGLTDIGSPGIPFPVYTSLSI